MSRILNTLDIKHVRQMLGRLSAEKIDMFDKEAALECLGQCICAQYMQRLYLYVLHGEEQKRSLMDQYILDAIDSEGYDVDLDTATDKERVQWLYDTFKSEYGHEIARRGLHGGLREWYMGLPSACNIEYRNNEILKLGVSWGLLPEKATDEQEDCFIEGWFSTIAYRTVALFREFGIIYLGA